MAFNETISILRAQLLRAENNSCPTTKTMDLVGVTKEAVCGAHVLRWKHNTKHANAG